ncbi:MAG: hypothetical protein IPM32_13460 [Ignavibacteriae bacterium]|nr:hypothetical protein [Ignavibacteriota bacterium]
MLLKIDRIVFLLLVILNFESSFAQSKSFKSISIISSNSYNKIEMNISQLLYERLIENGITEVFVNNNSEKENSADHLKILFGISTNHKEILEIFSKNRIEQLTEVNPGSEGFLLKFFPQNNVLIITGIDARGCLYGVGEFLRKVTFNKNLIEIEKNLEVRTAPAFEIRGTQFGQSHIAKSLAHVRDWTEKETQRVILEYALAGANIFNVQPGIMFDFIKSFGLMTQGGFGANTANIDVPKEWNAYESIGRTGYVCLSVPEARKFMLNKCEEHFRYSQTYDLINFHGGDGGGCECDKCNPYGLTFIKLVEEMAEIIHKYHPHTKVYFTNQKFDNEDDHAIFKYLQEKPRNWLWAWGYGPGSDATTWQPGHRQTHRMDLFKYPGFGPFSLYPKEILHQLPPQQKLVYYSEITHWKYSQHGYIQMYPRADRNGDQPPHWSHDIYERRPDQFLTMVYNRLTFYAWPKYYHRVFNDLMRYSIGDITHSSGHHDHFNQWMWQRLLWSPRLTVEQVVEEYCKYWFGKEATPKMSEAIFQLEQNLEEIKELPLDQKSGIDKYYKLVKAAGEKIPHEKYSKNWIWKSYMEKAALDKYVKLAVAQQKHLQNRIEEIVAKSIKNNSKLNFDELLKMIDTINETKEMKLLKEEAKILGEETNKLFGVRNEGYFNLQHDFIGLGWLKRQLERAKNTQNEMDRLKLLQLIINYENAGEGGYYDNLGTYNNAPHVIFGYPYDHGQPYVNEMLDEGNRPSQRSMHFTQNENQGVTLYYDNLDSTANYSVRFTFVRPWYQPRYDYRMNQKSQTIYADDLIISKELEIPLKMSDFYEFQIPFEATKDGKLTIKLEKTESVANRSRVEIEQWRNSGGWGTIVSEVWLIKK